jgi:hypothetical protein
MDLDTTPQEPAPTPRRRSLGLLVAASALTWAAFVGARRVLSIDAYPKAHPGSGWVVNTEATAISWARVVGLSPTGAHKPFRAGLTPLLASLWRHASSDPALEALLAQLDLDPDGQRVCTAIAAWARGRDETAAPPVELRWARAACGDVLSDQDLTFLFGQLLDLGPATTSDSWIPSICRNYASRRPSTLPRLECRPRDRSPTQPTPGADPRSTGRISAVDHRDQPAAGAEATVRRLLAAQVAQRATADGELRVRRDEDDPSVREKAQRDLRRAAEHRLGPAPAYVTYRRPFLVAAGIAFGLIGFVAALCAGGLVWGLAASLCALVRRRRSTRRRMQRITPPGSADRAAPRPAGAGEHRARWRASRKSPPSLIGAAVSCPEAFDDDIELQYGDHVLWAVADAAIEVSLLVGSVVLVKLWVHGSVAVQSGLEAVIASTSLIWLYLVVRALPKLFGQAVACCDWLAGSVLVRVRAASNERDSAWIRRFHGFVALVTGLVALLLAWLLLTAPWARLVAPFDAGPLWWQLWPALFAGLPAGGLLVVLMLMIVELDEWRRSPRRVPASDTSAIEPQGAYPFPTVECELRDDAIRPAPLSTIRPGRAIDSVQIAHWSDLHVADGKRTLENEPEGSIALKQLAEQYRDELRACDAVLVTGDVTDTGAWADWNKFLEIAQGLPNLIVLPGNHDINIPPRRTGWWFGAVYGGRLLATERHSCPARHLRLLRTACMMDHLQGDRAFVFDEKHGCVSLRQRLNDITDGITEYCYYISRAGHLAPDLDIKRIPNIAGLWESLFPMVVLPRKPEGGGSSPWRDSPLAVVLLDTVTHSSHLLTNAFGALPAEAIERLDKMVGSTGTSTTLLYAMHHALQLPPHSRAPSQPSTWWTRVKRRGMAMTGGAALREFLGSRPARSVVFHGHLHVDAPLAQPWGYLVGARSTTLGDSSRPKSRKPGFVIHTVPLRVTR